MLPDIGSLEYFHFLRPAWAVLVVPWFAMLWVRRKQRARSDLFGGIIAPHLLEHLRVSQFERPWFNPQTASNILVALVIVLLMGPSWRQQPSPLSEDDSALIVMLDVSRSMQQQDVQPTRLDRAKQKVSDLLTLRPDKKTALVVYSGSAHTVLALTSDQDILRQYLAAIEPGIMPRSGKFPEYTLPQVDTVLRETSAPATLLLLTDGLGAASNTVFADWFSERPHQLVVVGVGSDNADSGGIPLEESRLRALAREVGGHYVTLTVDDSDMRTVSRRVSAHYVVMENSALPWLDSGYWLVFPAMLIFLLWFRRGWTLTWMWIFLPLMVLSPGPVAQSHAQDIVSTTAVAEGTANPTPSSGEKLTDWFAHLWLTGDQYGRLLMQRGHYQAAATQFENPMWKALAYYYDEQFMLAAEYFSRTDSNDALFNEANARAHARDYVRAVNRYDRLLAKDPEYPGAVENRARVQAIIDEINRMSASQQQEPGTSSEDKQLDSSDEIPAEGADELTWEQAEIKQLSAEDILQDERTQDMWLRAVQQNPANFLAIKFNMQLNREQPAKAAGESP